MQLPLHLIGYACGQAAGDSGCADGPDAFQQSEQFKTLIQEQPNISWDTTFYPRHSADKYTNIQTICQHLALKAQTLINKGERFVTIGGDHSCAIGTWSGVHQAIALRGAMGLIWIDAHMDSHTPQTSPSGNIHGMPLAVLLGYGNHQLTQLLQPMPKVSPEHICLIGIRSFEPGEAELLKYLGVRVFYMDEVVKRGFSTVFTEAVSIVENNTAGFGVSIDLDSLDPEEAPGVGTPAANGLSTKALCLSLERIKHKKNFLAAEITEFNPHHDKRHKTEKIMYQLICAMNDIP